MTADKTGNPDERVQLNITFRQGTLDELNEAFPTALEDSERVRHAVSQSLERHHAMEYTISHN